MEKKDLDKKLERGYEDMLTSIHDFIEIEGKTIQEAVDAAEGKLSEWNELTREEVSKISGDVREDISHFGEIWNEEKAYFQEKLDLDKAYLKASIWDKLSAIANTATLDLIEFQKDLQERVGEFQLNEHQEHTAWRSDHEFWLTETELWEKENEHAKEMLATIEKAVAANKEQFQQHAHSISSQEATNRQHEETLSKTIKDPSNEEYQEENNKTDDEHTQMRNLHREQAAVHTKLKSKHRKTMVAIKQLYKLTEK